ncbi:MAG: hypothetical protein FWD02_03210 [Bacteroidales bacterium]|nr:hypothetical protein [Bacteroidales bacterium]
MNKNKLNLRNMAKMIACLVVVSKTKLLVVLVALIGFGLSANAQLTTVQNSDGSWDVFNNEGEHVTSGRAFKTEGNWYNVRNSDGSWDVFDSNGRHITSGRASRIPASTWYNVQSNDNSRVWNVFNGDGQHITSGRAVKTSGDWYNVQQNGDRRLWDVFNSEGQHITFGRATRVSGRDLYNVHSHGVGWRVFNDRGFLVATGRMEHGRIVETSFGFLGSWMHF